jgi:hypothetical protein
VTWLASKATHLLTTEPSPCSTTSAAWFDPAAAQAEGTGDPGASEANAATDTAMTKVTARRRISVSPPA